MYIVQGGKPNWSVDGSDGEQKKNQSPHIAPTSENVLHIIILLSIQFDGIIIIIAYRSRVLHTNVVFRPVG